MSENLEKIDAAIAAIRDGKRIQEFTVNGKNVKHAEVSLAELRSLREEEIARLNSRRRIRIGNFRGGKGL